MVWYSHLFQNFPQFIVIHTVKGFGIVNKAEIDVFLDSLAFSMIQRMLAMAFKLYLISIYFHFSFISLTLILTYRYNIIIIRKNNLSLLDFNINTMKYLWDSKGTWAQIHKKHLLDALM